MGTSWLPAKSADSFLSATPSLGSLLSNAGVTSTSPIHNVEVSGSPDVELC